MGNLRRVHSGELRCLFVCLFVCLLASTNIRLMKLRRIRWTRHVARMEEKIIRDFGGDT